LEVQKLNTDGMNVWANLLRPSGLTNVDHRGNGKISLKHH